MNKKILAGITALCLTAALFTGCSNKTTQTTNDTTTITDTTTDKTTTVTTSNDSPTNSTLSDGDYKDMTDETYSAEITLEGDTGTISDTTRGSSGSTVTINSKGIYHITGESDGVTVQVNDTKESGNIYLIFDNVTMTNTTACVDVEAADKVIIQCVGNTTLTSTATEDGAVYAKDDLTINGSGTLTVVSNNHGIECSDDLAITGGRVTVTADSAGIKAHDSISIDGAEIDVTSGKDGIKIDSDEGTGYVHIVSGTVTIDAQGDGIDAGSDVAEVYTGYVNLEGGTLNITAGGGSDNSTGESSQKGVKSAGDIFIGDVELNISSADDAVSADGNINVTGGVSTLSTSDDGVTADGDLTVSGGEISITKSYEALEAANITISGGAVSAVSSDDGVNGESMVTVSGGSLYVNSGGDGIDCNGSIYITGGTVIVEGPQNSGNGALDKGDSPECVLSITGGTVLATGSAGMAVNFDSGSQCSALVTLSIKSGDTITTSDGFTYTATKDAECAVYSSPNLTEGETYTITSGNATATMDFTSGLYYSDVNGMMMGRGMPMGR
jgi:hypothetical protein